MSTKSSLHEVTKTRILTVIILSSVIVSFSPIILVNANPLTITISPTRGSFGTRVKVHGTECTPDGEVRIYFSTLIGFFAATTNANSSGGYSVNITVPSFPAGTYNILAQDVTTGDTNYVPFIIQPKITLAPYEVSCADEVTVKAHGFRSEVPVSLDFDGIDVTPWPQPRTDGFGSFEAKFNVPKVPKGIHKVNASGGIYHTSASIRVIPKITLNPTSGPQATTVFANGTGFSSFSAVSILIKSVNHINVTIYPTFQTGLDGSFNHLFLIPDLPEGEYTLNATDATGNSASAPFLIPSPILTVEPEKVFGSTIVTARGKGFPPSQPVLLYLESNIIVNLLDLMTQSETLYADEYGKYEYSFIMPVTKLGVYRVAAYNIANQGFIAGEELASTSLTVVADTLLTGIKNDIATIIVPDLGMIKENLTSIKAKLVSLEGSTATINSTMGMIRTDISNLGLNITRIDGNVATIQTTLGTIQGRIESIEGDTATIETEIGTVVADVSNFKGEQESFTIPLYVGIALTLVAVLGIIYLTVIHWQAMRKPVEE